MKLIDTIQYANGKAVESFLDDFFRARGFHIEALTPDEERREKLGDRRFSKDGRTMNVEYKSGIQTYTTGNVFIETISVDTTGEPGWVFTCRADYIMYAALLNKKILVFIPARLRECVPALSQMFRTVHTCKNQNDGYNTHGIIVPLAYTEKHLATQVLHLA